jgi:hypothetical protein
MFAAAALQGLLAGGISNYNKPDGSPIASRADLAEVCFSYAKFMVEHDPDQLK